MLIFPCQLCESDTRAVAAIDSNQNKLNICLKKEIDWIWITCRKVSLWRADTWCDYNSKAWGPAMETAHFLSRWTAFTILSLPLLISFRNLVSVFQQLYQRVIRLLRTTLWSKALHAIKTTSWLVSSTVGPPPQPCGPGWLWPSTMKRPMTMRSCWPAVFVIQRQQPKSDMEDPIMFPFLYRFKLWVFTG